jgi:hypothetical protein
MRLVCFGLRFLDLAEMPSTVDAAQTEASDCAAGEATYVRFQIRSGTDAFAAVFSIGIFS